MFTNKHEDNLEDLVDGRYKRLRQLDAATLLMKGKHDIKNELQRMYNEILKVSCGVENMKKDLERMKEQNGHFRELLSLIELLDKRIVHQEESVSPELIQDYLNADKQTSAPTPFTSNILNRTVNSARQLTVQRTPRNTYINDNIEKQEVKDCKRMLFNEPEICPKIPLITTEEFNKVPKYIIGRQSLETINSFINAINQTLIAKYTILSSGKAAAQRKGEINLYLHYTRQEFDAREENGYLYFFTAEDYYRQTKTKIDKTKLNLLTALRHCKRLRECRIKNGLRYVITPH